MDTMISSSNKLIPLCNKVILQLSYSETYVAMIMNRACLLLKHVFHKIKTIYPVLTCITMHLCLNA